MLTIALLLVLISAILVAAEAHVPTHGVLGSAAVGTLAVGAALTLSAAGTAALVAVLGALLVAAAGATWVALIVRSAVPTRRLRAQNRLVGRVGVVRASDHVFVDGALWRARVSDYDGEPPLQRGEQVVVEHIDGLTLTVRHAERWELA